jgi:hypothetical protein
MRPKDRAYTPDANERIRHEQTENIKSCTTAYDSFKIA